MSSSDENISSLLELIDAPLISIIKKKFYYYGLSDEKFHGVIDQMKNELIVVKLQEEIKAQKISLLEGFEAITRAIEKKCYEHGLLDEKIYQVTGQLKNDIKIAKQFILAYSSQSQVEENWGVTFQKNRREETRVEQRKRAAQVKILYDLCDELHLIVERGRMKNVVHKHRELHPINKEVCTICLEDVSITSVTSVQYFICCGNFTCFQCFQAVCAKGIKKCPCCREEILITMDKWVRQTEQQAKRGRHWAQTQMGIYFLEGSSCQHGDAVHHKVDVREALKWFKLAAEQKHPDAIRNIAQIHAGVYGKVKEVEQCQIKARALMKEAADLGNLRAQRNYAMMSRIGQGGPVDHSEAARYYTLVYSQKDEVSPLEISDDFLPEEVLHGDGGLFLGMYHFNGDGGLTKNLRTAKYYLEEHVKESEKQGSIMLPDAYMYLGACLMELQEIEFPCERLKEFECQCDIPFLKASTLFSVLVSRHS